METFVIGGNTYQIHPDITIPLDRIEIHEQMAWQKQTPPIICRDDISYLRGYFLTAQHSPLYAYRII